MRYRFARFCTRMLIVLGALSLVAGPLVGLAAVFLPLRESPTPVWAAVLGILGGLLAGLLVGVPLILAGQLVQVFLDQRSLLVKIYRQLKRRGTDDVDDIHDKHTRRIAERYLKR